MLNNYQVEMHFKGNPGLYLSISAANKNQARELAKDEAMRGGFGIPKKMQMTRK